MLHLYETECKEVSKYHNSKNHFTFFKNSKIGVGSYMKIARPIIEELNICKETLQNNPDCLMVKDVAKAYIKRLEDAAKDLLDIKIADDVASSNHCFFDYIAKELRTHAKEWQEISQDMEDLNSITLNEMEFKKANRGMVNMLGELLDNILKALEYVAQKLKTGDIHQKQLELAHLISDLIANQKVEKLKVRNLEFGKSLEVIENFFSINW